MSRHARRHLLPWFAMSALLCVAGTAAAADPSTKCQAAKLVAAGRAGADVLGCHASAAADGVAVDPVCVAKAHTRLSSSYARREAGGACITTGDATVLQDEVDRMVFFIRLALPFAAEPSRCSAARLRVFGRYVVKTAKLLARDRQRPSPDLEDDLVAVRIRLFASYDDAESFGDCGQYSGAAFDTVDTYVRRMLGHLFAICLDGVRHPLEQCDTNDDAACPFACNRDCTCPHCGDGRVNRPGEICDGADASACGGLPCQPGCTCPPPACGDGVKQTGEDCDGADAAACAGLCQADCTCPTPLCGNGVTETGEQCDGASGYCFVYTCGVPSGAMACRCCASGNSVFFDLLIELPRCCDGSQCRVYAAHSCTCDPSTCMPAGYPCTLEVGCCAGLTCNGTCE